MAGFVFRVGGWGNKQDPTPTSASGGTTYGVSLTFGMNQGCFTTAAVVCAGTERFLASWTITNTSSGTVTNAPTRFGVPLSANALASSEYIKLYYGDGLGSPVAEVANYNGVKAMRADDWNNATRFMRMDMITSSFTASASKEIVLMAATGTGPSGQTIITSSDIHATNANIELVRVISGVTIVACLRSAFGASNSWILTSAVDHGRLPISGGACTGYMYSVPFRQGTSVHQEGFGERAFFHVYAYKADKTAVSATNPISQINIDVLLEGAIVTAGGAARPQDYVGSYTILRSTLTAATLTTVESFPRTEPAAVVRIVNGTESNNSTVASISTGSWDTVIVGKPIVEVGGTGRAMICRRIDNTHVNVRVLDTFSQTSLDSSEWALDGIWHWWGGRDRRRVNIGGNVSIVALPGNVSSALSPTTNGAIEYLRGSEMILNHKVGLTDVPTHSMTLTCITGDYPFGYGIQSTGANNYHCNEVLMLQETAGNYANIGWLPQYYVEGLARPNVQGQQRIYWNAATAHKYNYHIRQDSTGVQTRMTSVSYRYKTGSGAGTLVSLGPNQGSPGDSGISHGPQLFGLPYLLTGDWVWLEELQFFHWHVWAGNDSTFHGVSIRRSDQGNGSNGFAGTGSTQMRAGAWALGPESEHSVLVPSSVNSLCLGWPRTEIRANVSFIYQFMCSGGPGNTDRGSNTYTASGIAWTQGGNGVNGFGNNRQYGPWQQCYYAGIMKHAKEVGAWNANSASVMRWFYDSAMGLYNARVSCVFYNMLTGYYIATEEFNGGAQVRSWGDCYQHTAINERIGNGAVLDPRSTTQIAVMNTVAGSVAAPIVVSWHENLFGAGSLFYVSTGAGSFGGGWCYSDGGGKGRIVSVVNASVVHLITTSGSTFESLSHSARTLDPPAPHPNDFVLANCSGGDTNYMDLWNTTYNWLEDEGYADALAAKTCITNRPDYPASKQLKHRISAR